MSYEITLQPLAGKITASQNGCVIAESENAYVMYETGHQPTIYFPENDLTIDGLDESPFRTFCPFKGTASYKHVEINDEIFENGIWFYPTPIEEVEAIRDYVAFQPALKLSYDLGTNEVRSVSHFTTSNGLFDWLLKEAHKCINAQDLTQSLANSLVKCGLSLSRLNVTIWSLHPLLAGKNYRWSASTEEVSVFEPTYAIHQDQAFLDSPLKFVSEGLGGVRQRIAPDQVDFEFPIISELQAEGATDYVAMPLRFSNGQINVLTLTSSAPSGFSTEELGIVYDAAPLVARYFEVFNQNSTSESLLATYLGRRTGQKVLEGSVRRGDGEVIEAAVLFCDLRGSSALEESIGQDLYLNLLNCFFEETTTCVRQHNGEVLKFIGDAVLAIFPLEDGGDDACKNAIATAKQIIQALKDLDHQSLGSSEAIKCAIGIDYGAVTYGNVGSQDRLDFTVIGRTANVAARLADLSKKLEQNIVSTHLPSGKIEDAVHLGSFKLRNLSGTTECYTY